MKTGVVCTAIALAALLAGCVAQPVAPAPAIIAAQIKPGDRIRVVTRSGSEGEFRVVRVDRESVSVQPVGRKHKEPEQSIAYSDIRELSVTRADRRAIRGGLIAATIVAGVAFYEAMEAAAAGALCC